MHNTKNMYLKVPIDFFFRDGFRLEGKVNLKHLTKQDMVAHACNPSTWETMGVLG